MSECADYDLLRSQSIRRLFRHAGAIHHTEFDGFLTSNLDSLRSGERLRQKQCSASELAEKWHDVSWVNPPSGMHELIMFLASNG
jgi:hypothetical protein